MPIVYHRNMKGIIGAMYCNRPVSQKQSDAGKVNYLMNKSVTEEKTMAKGVIEKSAVSIKVFSSPFNKWTVHGKYTTI